MDVALGAWLIGIETDFANLSGERSYSLSYYTNGALLYTVRCSAVTRGTWLSLWESCRRSRLRGENMTIPKDNSQLENARRLRSEMTPHERKLWYLFLRKYPVKIYKQRIIGRFIVDFYCASAKLVIELDGSQHYEPQGMAYDSERSAFLTALGLEVLRFSNRDVDRNFRGVCTQIDITIQKRL